MWPILVNLLRSYAPYITLPVAAAVGVIGYNIERFFRKPPPNRPSTEDLRDERLLKEMIQMTESMPAPLSEKVFVPRTIFEKNVSPSLAKKD